MYIFMYIYIERGMYLCIYIYVYIYVYIYRERYVFMYIYICIYLCIYIERGMYLCIYICLYLCIYIERGMYLCMKTFSDAYAVLYSIFCVRSLALIQGSFFAVVLLSSILLAC